MDKDLFEIKGDLDVEALMARITESTKEEPISTRGRLAEPSPRKNLNFLKLEDVNGEVRLAGPLANAINQIPLKAKGLKGEIELRIKAFLKWLVHWNTKAQADFNASLLRSIGLLAEHIRSLQRVIAALERSVQREAERNIEATRQIENLAAMVKEVVTDSQQMGPRLNERLDHVSAMIEDTRKSTEALSAHSSEWDRNALETRQLREQVVSLSSMLEDISRRSDAGVANLEAFEQKTGREIEDSTRNLQAESRAAEAALREEMNRKLRHELDEVRMRILRAERGSATAAANRAIDPSRPVPKRDAALAKTGLHDPHDKTNGRETSRATPSAGEEWSNPSFDYFMFEHRFRGSASEIRQRQSVYVDLFLDKDNVLDLGCGRGEFLELLSENGVNATGVDNNQDMVDFCLDRGLRVNRADMFEYLSSLPDASLDGIFASQVVEHFPPDQILRLISLCGDKLKPDGVFVAETMNANCQAAMANFYIDPTHVRPVPAEMLRFMFEQGPYKIRSLRFTAPISVSNPEVLDMSSGLPLEVGDYQDYAVIARRVSGG